MRMLVRIRQLVRVCTHTHTLSLSSLLARFVLSLRKGQESGRLDGLGLREEGDDGREHRHGREELLVGLIKAAIDDQEG
jgi:hypothetical protein